MRDRREEEDAVRGARGPKLLHLILGLFVAVACGRAGFVAAEVWSSSPCVLKKQVNLQKALQAFTY